MGSTTSSSSSKASSSSISISSLHQTPIVRTTTALTTRRTTTTRIPPKERPLSIFDVSQFKARSVLVRECQTILHLLQMLSGDTANDDREHHDSKKKLRSDSCVDDNVLFVSGRRVPLQNYGDPVSSIWTGQFTFVPRRGELRGPLGPAAIDADLAKRLFFVDDDLGHLDSVTDEKRHHHHSSGVFTVFVKQNVGDVLTLEKVSGWTTVEQVKRRIQRKQGIPVKDQRLLYGAKELLDNDRALADFDVQSESTLHLSLRLCGGAGGGSVGGGITSVGTSFQFLNISHDRAEATTTDRRGARVIPWASAKDNPQLWTHVRPGLCLEGFCTNTACRAFGKNVYVNRGFSRFNVADDADLVQCPMCHHQIETITGCGFNNCYWIYQGVIDERSSSSRTTYHSPTTTTTTEDKKLCVSYVPSLSSSSLCSLSTGLSSGSGSSGGEGGFKRCSPSSWQYQGNTYWTFRTADSDNVTWRSLVIRTEEKAPVCPICLGEEPNSQTRCHHDFHEDCLNNYKTNHTTRWGSHSPALCPMCHIPLS